MVTFTKAKLVENNYDFHSFPLKVGDKWMNTVGKKIKVVNIGETAWSRYQGINRTPPKNPVVEIEYESRHSGITYFVDKRAVVISLLTGSYTDYKTFNSCLRIILNKEELSKFAKRKVVRGKYGLRYQDIVYIRSTYPDYRFFTCCKDNFYMSSNQYIDYTPIKDEFMTYFTDRKNYFKLIVNKSIQQNEDAFNDSIFII